MKTAMSTALATGLVAASLSLTGSPATAMAATTPVAGRAMGSADLPGPRKLVRYVVRPGETASELAVRYHAWTAELIRYNHLGANGRMYAGERITIPVVPDYLRDSPTAKPKKAKPAKAKATKTVKHGKPSASDPSRATVRRQVIRTARARGVDPKLALAVSWQESGWQMHHVSSANAIGAMQVLPGTGTWMSMYAGRPLNLRVLKDNVLAGVLLLKFLDDNTSSTTHQVAAYYQGLRAVQERGLYGETRQYVANVLAIRKQLARGWNPAR
jgi:soluble lytic murein transglycosylase-like protein